MLGCNIKIGSTLNAKERKKDLNMSQISGEKLVTKFAKKMPYTQKFVEQCLHMLLVDFCLYPFKNRNETFRMDEAISKYVSEVVELLAI